MFPYLRLGPLLVQLPGLALLVGVWVGSLLAEREAHRLKGVAADIYNLIFIGLASGIVGARLTYAARYLGVYLANPLSLFALNGNTLAVSDGLIIGMAAAALYIWRKKLPVRSTLDALAPGFAVFMVFLGVGHILSGDAFGASSHLPWSIYLWGEYRHPSQFYEVMAGLVTLAVILRRPLETAGQGLNFLLAIALSAAARILLEAFRGDSLIWGGGFRAAQVLGLIVLIAALWLMRRWIQPDDKILTERR